MTMAGPTDRPLLLDLFSCEGGGAEGYHRAGFDVIGVDIKPQPRYPFRFVQADALRLPFDLAKFDAIHASPPCQAYSRSTAGTGDPSLHPDLVALVREMLNASGRPWVMENVEGAPLRPDMILCGSMFGLQVRRHRIFEFRDFDFREAPPCRHEEQMAEYDRLVDVTGRPGGLNQTLRPGKPIKYYNQTHAREVMQMPWASRHGCTQAIPPAYTELIGRQLLEEIR